LQDKLLILLHPGQPVPTGSVWSLWSWDPTVLVGCAALVVCYVWILRGWLGARFYLFFAGVLVLMLALVSPLDTLADHYLFSAHMLQHVHLLVGKGGIVE